MIIVILGEITNKINTVGNYSNIYIFYIVCDFIPQLILTFYFNVIWYIMFAIAKR